MFSMYIFTISFVIVLESNVAVLEPSLVSVTECRCVSVCLRNEPRRAPDDSCRGVRLFLHFQLSVQKCQ